MKFPKKVRMTGLPFFSVRTFLPYFRQSSSTSGLVNPLVRVLMECKTSAAESF